MPLVTLRDSPLAGGPAEIYYRESGSGVPVVFLHGGWGYDIYPLDAQAQTIQDFRVLIPDRSGYGRSTKPAIFGLDLHKQAVEETLQFLDALNVRRCIFWGHSDGAVIAAMLGLSEPERCIGLVLEAIHYDREKISSRSFFQSMASEPESFGRRVTDILKKEHGAPLESTAAQRGTSLARHCPLGEWRATRPFRWQTFESGCSHHIHSWSARPSYRTVGTRRDPKRTASRRHARNRIGRTQSSLRSSVVQGI